MLNIFAENFVNKYSRESDRTYTFYGCFDTHLVLRQLTDITLKWRELSKMIPSLLAVKETSPFWFCVRIFKIGKILSVLFFRQELLYETLFIVLVISPRWNSPRRCEGVYPPRSFNQSASTERRSYSRQANRSSQV